MEEIRKVCCNAHAHTCMHTLREAKPIYRKSRDSLMSLIFKAISA